ncbi:hypothetical protein [Paludibaculum fermentans]|uniref:Uncharacterized protein n=1 Tax=Paludibaculum fermentans TaxID=1473598 RepID=A0A7S7NKH3_PALFE|nr:hypothetical protein [Paludibaculum fermentans]QOY85204.1 hypothetical protein IRI77_20425 [Paludibaculum fermentans]
MVQRALAWGVLAVLLILTIFGIVHNGLAGQSVWAPVGLARFAGFAVFYALFTGVMLLKAPRWYLPALAGSMVIYTMLAVGPLAPLAVGYFGASCFAIGGIWFRRHPAFTARSPQMAVLTGLATWVFFVLVTAGLPIHYRALYWILPAIPIYYALRYQWLPALEFDYPKTAHDLAPLSVALFPLACHWLVVLKPEVSADGLAMHTVIPSRMTYAHSWNFNIHEFIWAVMPMGGDFLYSIGWQMAGEYGARLLNLGVLALIVWILMERLHARVPGWIASLLAAAFLSTPLTQQVTGSLFVENLEAVVLLGAALLLRVHVKERRGVYFYACCFLTGIAMATKLGALAFALPLLAAAVVLVKFRHLVLGLPIAVLVGGYTYVSAWVRTSNPVFPFFNAVFHSPLYDVQKNFIDVRFATPPSWRLWYDLTFHTSRYLEGLDGGFGFFFFLLVPVALVGVRRRWPRTGFVLLWVGLAGLAGTFARQSNLRYAYPALPMLTLLIGIAISSFRAHGPELGRALGWAAGLTVVLNLFFLPSAGWYHREFALNQVLSRKPVDEYLAVSAPERKLVDWLNAHDPNERAAWMENNAVADFHGYAFTNSWHSVLFSTRLRESTSPEGHSWLAQDLKIKYFLAPSASSPKPATNVYSRDFLDAFTKPVASFGDMELRQWAPPAPGMQGPPPAFAPPGTYDEVTRFSHFSGRWSRDLQFTQAYEGTLVYTNDTRSRLLIRFRGRSIQLKYTAAANRCSGLVSIDEGEEKPVNEFSLETKWQTLSPEYDAGNPGEHLMQLRFPEGVSKIPIASCYLDLDGFIVR